MSHASEGDRLQRLFSTFPARWPGVGLLVLRAAVGLTAAVEGGEYIAISGPTSPGTLAVGLVLVAGGASLLAGLLTPLAAIADRIVRRRSRSALAPHAQPDPLRRRPDDCLRRHRRPGDRPARSRRLLDRLLPVRPPRDRHPAGRLPGTCGDTQPGHSTVTVTGDSQTGQSREEIDSFCVQSSRYQAVCPSFYETWSFTPPVWHVADGRGNATRAPGTLNRDCPL